MSISDHHHVRLLTIVYELLLQVCQHVQSRPADRRAVPSATSSAALNVIALLRSQPIAVSVRNILLIEIFELLLQGLHAVLERQQHSSVQVAKATVLHEVAIAGDESGQLWITLRHIIHCLDTL
jgi:hypothetical protein